MWTENERHVVADILLKLGKPDIASGIRMSSPYTEFLTMAKIVAETARKLGRVDWIEQMEFAGLVYPS